ncbi:MAG TPA: C-terminal binding protein [Isosphaeraceae bacterium]|jgi:phosphoglycerate dehydrogenase-like enzyme|nr:C-terminal binding protein [Isosphaeraceae bacterium]
MSEPLRVVITDFLEDTSEETPVLGDIAQLVVAGAHGEQDLSHHLPTADGLIVYHDVPMITDASFAQAERCRVIVRAGVGFNNVQIEAAGRRGILVCNVPDYGTEEVADHAIMLLLAVARQLVASDQSMRRGEWDYRVAETSPRMRGKTFGVIGCGRIGSATASRAKALGLDVVFYDPYLPDGYDKALGIRRVSRLEDLLEQSRFVSLHCYLDEKSYHLIDAKALARMPAESILINTARGPVVDQKALVEALDRGHLMGAGLDVFENEPLDDDRLRRHPRVVLTPHSAFYSLEGFAELRRKAAEEVRRVLTGEPPRNLVNRQYLLKPRARVS